MRGHISEISDICGVTQKAAECAVGNAASPKGLGVPIVQEFLRNVPGLRRPSLDDYFANVKASGEYARIIEDVKKSIDDELAASMRDRREFDGWR